MKFARLLGLGVLSLGLGGCGRDPAAAIEAPAGEAHELREEAPGRIHLKPEQIEKAGIGLATAGSANIHERLPLYGVITLNAERVREVGARFPGVIRSVSKRAGDIVAQGETLATVESNESLQTYSILSPLKGVVTARNANPGEQAAEKSLFTVADLSTVWVELSLFPRDVARVHAGQVVRVRSADAKLVAEGKVIYVAPFGTSANQTLSARVLLDNAERKWPPGLYVSAEVTLATTAVPLAVSSEALQMLNERKVVFVIDKEGFAPKQITAGRADGVLTEILAGLAPGAVYATKNSFILKAELGKGEAEHEH